MPAWKSSGLPEKFIVCFSPNLAETPALPLSHHLLEVACSWECVPLKTQKFLSQGPKNHSFETYSSGRLGILPRLCEGRILVSVPVSWLNSIYTDQLFVIFLIFDSIELLSCFSLSLTFFRMPKWWVCKSEWSSVLSPTASSWTKSLFTALTSVCCVSLTHSSSVHLWDTQWYAEFLPSYPPYFAIWLDHALNKPRTWDPRVTTHPTLGEVNAYWTLKLCLPGPPAPISVPSCLLIFSLLTNIILLMCSNVSS